MDHLPWRHANRQRPRIPYLCEDVKDKDIRYRFKDVEEWQVELLSLMHGNTNTMIRDLAIFCQKRLFFGMIRLLVEYVEERFSLQDYVDLDHSQLVDTSRMNRILKLLLKKNKYSAYGLDRRCRKRLDHLYRMLLTMISHPSLDGCGDYFEVFWATALLLEGVESLIKKKDGGINPSPRLLLMQQTAHILSRHSLVRDLIGAAGTCATLPYYRPMSLSQTWTVIATPVTAVDTEAARGFSHQDCTGHYCTAFDTSPDTYVKCHSPECSTDQLCYLKGVDTNKLDQLVRLHAIPIIQSTVDADGIHIDIVDSRCVPAFVAISHVWAGGLGNPENNSIYTCQFEFLHAKIAANKKLGGTLYYWLDTLCVPVADKQLRQEAIGEMARVYASARQVLVLDPILQRTAVRELLPCEVEALVLSSPWNARSWTLQESALAVDLRFLFLDDTISCDKIVSDDHAGDTRQRNDWKVLWWRDVDRLRSDAPKHSLSPASKLLSVWQELYRRNSTMVEDLAAIIPVFIDRNARDILRIESSADGLDDELLRKRIHTILGSVGSIPASFLFAPTFDGLDYWCPQLPRCTNSTTLQSNSTLDIVEGGLLASNNLDDLFILRSVGALPVEGSFIVCDHFGGRQFEIFFPEAMMHSKMKSAKEYDSLLILPRWAVTSECAGQELHGVLFKVQPGNLAPEHAIFQRSFKWRLRGLLEPFVSEAESALGHSMSERTFALAQYPPLTDCYLESGYELVLDMGTYSTQFLFLH